MKVTELRIGNLVTLDPSKNWHPKKDDYTREVDSIMHEGINDMGEYNFMGDRIEDLAPIPLTEEWLNQKPHKTESWKGNGADYQPETSKTTQNWYWLKEDVYLVFETWSYRKTENDEWIHETSIKLGNHGDFIQLQKEEVHFLQNLYYFLYLEELEIKE